jgi:hypothetical protein
MTEASLRSLLAAELEKHPDQEYARARQFLLCVRHCFKKAMLAKGLARMTANPSSALRRFTPTDPAFFEGGQLVSRRSVRYSDAEGPRQISVEEVMAQLPPDLYVTYYRTVDVYSFSVSVYCNKRRDGLQVRTVIKKHTKIYLFIHSYIPGRSAEGGSAQLKELRR